jgi:hypothetical protein
MFEFLILYCYLLIQVLPIPTLNGSKEILSNSFALREYTNSPLKERARSLLGLKFRNA